MPLFSTTRPKPDDDVAVIAKKILMIWRLTKPAPAKNAPKMDDDYVTTLRKILNTLLEV
jgi:hypothetical protein